MIKKYGKIEYEVEALEEAIRKYPNVMKKLAYAKEKAEELRAESESCLEEADDIMEEAQMDYNNIISEWVDFPPFKYKLKKVFPK